MFEDLISTHYGAILVDPPWAFKTYSGKHITPHRRFAGDHYNTMSIDEISALPVADLASKNCALFMWVVDSHLDVALDVGISWGFVYKTISFIWCKTAFNGNRSLSLGYWTRKQAEICLLFTKGSPKRKSGGVRQIIEAPRREHSRKPDEIYGCIEQLVPGPYCELFARYKRDGWNGWGNELKEVPKPKTLFSYLGR